MGHHWTDAFGEETEMEKIMRGTSTYTDFDKDRNDKRLLEEKLVKLENKYQELANLERAAPESGYQQPKPRSNLLWVGVDLDGTLAEHLWTPENPTSEIGDPIPESLEKVKELVAHGYKIIVHTSRPWTDYEAIEKWLVHYGIPFKEIQCGKPLYVAYVDDRAIRASEHSWLPS